VWNWIHASFNEPTPNLQPIPIMGLGYQWNFNFFRPLNLNIHHNWYVVVMIEHFFKWIELATLWDKSSERVAYAFLDQVLNRFGTSIEVFINQGTNGEKRFMKIWITKRAYKWLGHTIAMVGHGILIQEANIPCIIFPFLFFFGTWTPLTNIHL
jgi:hypothetical protein